MSPWSTTAKTTGMSLLWKASSLIARRSGTGPSKLRHKQGPDQINEWNSRSTDKSTTSNFGLSSYFQVAASQMWVFWIIWWYIIVNVVFAKQSNRKMSHWVLGSSDEQFLVKCSPIKITKRKMRQRGHSSSTTLIFISFVYSASQSWVNTPSGGVLVFVYLHTHMREYGFPGLLFLKSATVSGW